MRASEYYALDHALLLKNDLQQVESIVAQRALNALRRRPMYDASKRLFDISFALALLVAISPLLISAVVLVKVTSPGPAFFCQRRVCRSGRTFRCYKFRTMVKDAEAMLARSEMQEAFEVSWKLKNDPRITPVGRWLRKFSIDELPQLINVLRGEMSVVGPRPLQPREIEQHYGSLAEVVTAVKPGLTSVWAVSGRSDLAYSDRVSLDVEYVLRRSFLFDLQLVSRTILPVLLQRGAV